MIYNYYYTCNYQRDSREADKRVGASDARRRVDATILKSDDRDRGPIINLNHTMVMKSALNSMRRRGGYYLGCNFLLKASAVKTAPRGRMINSGCRVARNIFRDHARRPLHLGGRTRLSRFRAYFIAPGNFASESRLPLSAIYDGESLTRAATRAATRARRQPREI